MGPVPIGAVPNSIFFIDQLSLGFILENPYKALTFLASVADFWATGLFQVWTRNRPSH